jgi:hypothetical protein
VGSRLLQASYSSTTATELLASSSSGSGSNSYGICHTVTNTPHTASCIPPAAQGAALYRLLPALTCPGNTWAALTADNRRQLDDQRLGVWPVDSFNKHGRGRSCDTAAVEDFLDFIWKQRLVVHQKCRRVNVNEGDLGSLFNER